MKQSIKTNTAYPVPANPISLTYEIKKSRFIAHIAQASNVSDAKNFIHQIKNKYLDATHNCWAFQTGKPGSTRSIGCSDDGEPSGTAGRPILTVLTHAKVGELVAVVTRYYGGIKLGTGGLARAYAQSVNNALAELECCEKVIWQYASLSFEYDKQSAVEAILKANAAEVMSTEFAEKVSIKVCYGQGNKKLINQQLANLSQGRLKLA